MMLLPVLLAALPCEGCHAAVHAQSDDRHARAFSERLFQASWQQVNHRRWCLTCHDPLGGEQGVSCEACHAAAAADLEHHQQRREPDLTSSDFCAHCHQFSAPDGPFEHLPMQDTVHEWRAAADAGVTQTCQGCHFAGAHGGSPGHDLALLARTIQLHWRRDRGTRGLCATLAAQSVGHAVPTGDPWHQLRLVLCRDAGCAHGESSVALRRRLELTDAGVVEGVDTRVLPAEQGGREVCFEVAPTGRWFWRLELRHAEAGLGDRTPADEVVRVIERGEVR
jgi:hypothetical protein